MALFCMFVTFVHKTTFPLQNIHSFSRQNDREKRAVPSMSALFLEEKQKKDTLSKKLSLKIGMSQGPD